MDKKQESRLQKITEELERGVKELFTSEKYADYLKIMSHFHQYSFNNTILIAAQKPDATRVAGCTTWNRKFNRQVKKGEKGIWIFAPVPIKKKERMEKCDLEKGGQLPQNEDTQQKTKEPKRVAVRFRPVTVFDISQTWGDPLPQLGTEELTGDAENFEMFINAVRTVSPVPVRFADIRGTAKGYYSRTAKEIVIQADMSEKQTLKTAVHEAAHAICHDRDRMREAGEEKDTSDYSFPYITLWSGSMEMKELRSSMDFIRRTAGTLIDGMKGSLRGARDECGGLAGGREQK